MSPHGPLRPMNVQNALSDVDIFSIPLRTITIILMKKNTLDLRNLRNPTVLDAVTGGFSAFFWVPSRNISE